MAIGRLVKSAIKYGPIAYPIIRKVLNNRKKKDGEVVDTTQNRNSGSRKKR